MEIRDAVGRFFEQLASSVLRSRPLVNGTLDLGICKALVGLEVKGGNNSNRFRISVQQLEDHITSNLYLFPEMLEELLYCLFCYQSPRKPNGDGSHKTALSICRSEDEVFEVLAQNTDSVFVLDHRVILAIRKLLGTMTGQLLCEREIEVVSIGKTYLKGFTKYKAKERFLSLELDPEEWTIRERYVNVSIQLAGAKHKLKLRVTEVITKELMARLDQAIKIPRKRPARRTLVLKSKT